VESEGERWRFAALRLTAAECGVSLDGHEVTTFEKFNSGARADSSYHNGSHKIPTSP
jgi:hypothetical protein